MAFTVIIPARLKSSRLPDKPLADICGEPMVVRTARRAALSGADRTIVAVDDRAVLDVVEAAGFEAVLTRADHPTGTDRLSEVVEHLGLADDEIVVNLQGDEPVMPPYVLEQVAAVLEEHPESQMATAAHPITDIESFMNPNVVKVVLDAEGHAITFSRAPVPWPRDAFREDKTKLPENLGALHHIGLYAYRAGFLRRFPTLEQAPLEKTESLEQLRALYYGDRISVMVLDEALPAGVDTAEDLERVRRYYEDQEG